METVSLIVIAIIAGFLWALASYSVGFKAGKREGYALGRSVSRHASSKVASE